MNDISQRATRLEEGKEWRLEWDLKTHSDKNVSKEAAAQYREGVQWIKDKIVERLNLWGDIKKLGLLKTIDGTSLFREICKSKDPELMGKALQWIYSRLVEPLMEKYPLTTAEKRELDHCIKLFDKGELERQKLSDGSRLIDHVQALFDHYPQGAKEAILVEKTMSN